MLLNNFVLQPIKVSTKYEHCCLEAKYPFNVLIQPPFCVSEYRDALQVLCWSFELLAKQLPVIFPLVDWRDYVANHIRHLRRDLDESLMPCPAEKISLINPWQVYGALYVMIGASLGARQILALLKASLIEQGIAFSYYQDAAREKSYRQLADELTQLKPNDADIQQCILGAKQMFTLVSNLCETIEKTASTPVEVDMSNRQSNNPVPNAH